MGVRSLRLPSTIRIPSVLSSKARVGPRGPDLDLAVEPGRRDRIAIAIDAAEALHVDDPDLDPLGLGNEDGERMELSPLGGVQFVGHGVSQVPLRLGVDLLTPLTRLAVEIADVRVREGAPRQEVVLDVVEAPLDAPERLAFRGAWATKTKPKRSAKAAISGAGTMSLPVPQSRMTLVLSTMVRPAAPSKYRNASVRKTFASKRVKRK